jgi:hypothetical protein
MLWSSMPYMRLCSSALLSLWWQDDLCLLFLNSVLNTYKIENIHFLAAYTLAAKVDNQVAMDPNLDLDPETQPGELPHTTKLQAGYVRYIRIINEEVLRERFASRHAFAGRNPTTMTAMIPLRAGAILLRRGPPCMGRSHASAPSHHRRAQATSCNKSIPFPAARHITIRGASRLEE